MAYCPDRCIGGGPGGHHVNCPSAPIEPDHDDECEGPDCPGYITDLQAAQLGEDMEQECPCLCHEEPDDGL